jgi:hypothetical protein
VIRHSRTPYTEDFVALQRLLCGATSVFLTPARRGINHKLMAQGMKWIKYGFAALDVV